MQTEGYHHLKEQTKKLWIHPEGDHPKADKPSYF